MLTNTSNNTLLKFTDRSLQTNSEASVAYVVYGANNLIIHSQQEKLSNWSHSTTRNCDSILMALRYVVQLPAQAVIFSDHI